MSRFDRRFFLRGTAGAVIGLPTLASLMPRAEAQPAAAAGRFVFIAHPLGMYPELFFPTPPGAEPFEFPDASTCDPRQARCRPRVYRTGETAMSNPEFPLSRTLEPFAPHREDLLVLENIDNFSGNHKGYTCMSTGRPINDVKLATGISIDQELALHIGRETRFPALQVGVKSGEKPHSRHAVSWYGAGRAALPESNPERVFQRLFASTPTNNDDLARLRAQQRSVLDATLGQAQRLKNRLGRADQLKVDQYLASIRDVERRLSQTVEAGCGRPDAPPAGYDYKSTDLVEQTTTLQLDLLAMALACGLTNVATFQMGFEATNMRHPWLGVNTRWHDLSHTSGNEDNWIDLINGYVDIARWNAEQIAHFVDRLKRLEAWSDTLIMWTTPMHNAQYHNGHNIPITLLGNVGNQLATNRHVRFAAGEHVINDVLLTVLRLYGVHTDTFGVPDANRRPLTELLRSA